MITVNTTYRELVEDTKILTQRLRTRQGHEFEHGKPTTFNYIRNTAPAPNMGITFGQHLEPHGRYLIPDQTGGGELPKDSSGRTSWERGTVTLKKPFVLHYGNTSGDPEGWKHRLSQHFGGSTGKRLSNKMKKQGFDAVVTAHAPTGKDTYADVREIVKL